MSLDSIVNVSATLVSSAVSREDFGAICVASYHTNTVNLVEEYSSLAAMVTAGFSATDPAYRAVAAILAQNPHATTIKVAKLGTVPTEKHRITVNTATEDVTYTVKLNTTEFSHTATTGQTAAQIAGAIEDLITAGSEPVSATDNVDGTFDLAEDTPGAYYAVEIYDDSGVPGGLMSIDDTTTGYDLATDLAAIALEDDDWYVLVLGGPKPAAAITAAATYCETNDKLFLAASADSDIFGSGSSDIASAMKTASRARTSMWFHHAPAEFMDAALVGKMCAKDAGSATWVYKNLSGITASVLSDTHVSNLEGKYASSYRTLGGSGRTVSGESGNVAAGEWLDVIRGRDWFANALQADLADLLFTSDKIPFTDDGIAQVEAVIRGVVSRGIQRGFLTEDTTLPFVVPAAADISADDKAARKLTGISLGVRLAGAIHFIDPLTVTLSA